MTEENASSVSSNIRAGLNADMFHLQEGEKKVLLNA
jgi:hypothetical protein